jgi:hypothetical protein
VAAVVDEAHARFAEERGGALSLDLFASQPEG